LVITFPSGWLSLFPHSDWLKPDWSSLFLLVGYHLAGHHFPPFCLVKIWLAITFPPF
jgi:hypothetical protein